MLGENLKSVREKRGLTQEKLAKEVEVNRVNLAYYENGTKVPSVAVLTRIADTLDCSIDGLLDRKKFEDQNFEN
ncbi:MAG: helix-turn-helix domain-containing protein [Oscillospiraceae bacterium]|nr:helix-turn-helix domain-containing protein [Oscillospiraceae bacterium]